VRLVRQISNARCVQGRTFGLTSDTYGRGIVFVREGCRGDFRIRGFRR
jgi:hypothetical protein